MQRTPQLSVVVIIYNIPREAPRTLLSLSAAYQQHIAAADYEIIVVDNGSSPPFDERILQDLSGNFRLVRMDPADPSPAKAINRGLQESRGDIIGVMVDGARMLTPGVLHFALHGARLYRHSVVATLGWYLGFDLQKWAIEGGYNQEREDALLHSIDWPSDGYRLFEIGTPDESSAVGWFDSITESNGIFLFRAAWELLGGVEERFDFPGGGMLNPDTFRRAMELPGSELVILAGEASFHQLHGGVATNSKYESFKVAAAKWHQQYDAIRDQKWQSPAPSRRTFIGTLPKPALLHFARSIVKPFAPARSPLSPTFDSDIWSLSPPKRPDDAGIGAVIDSAHSEFRAGRFSVAAGVARLARSRAPDEPEPQRLLAHSGPTLLDDDPSPRLAAHFHYVLGEAHRLLGEEVAAEARFRKALTFDANHAQAYVGLAKLRMPGELYYSCLSRFHRALKPKSYLEIGISSGQSLALARPPTLAIGIDPTVKMTVPLRTETHIFTETSDVFFGKRRLDNLLDGFPLSLGFIDGSHVFEQALRDFAHLEAYCGPRSVLLLHDTLPSDEITQRPDRQKQFYTGDVWKVIPCLREFRPELDVFTIATPWSGLTVVVGFEPRDKGLVKRLDEAVAAFKELPFSTIENRMDDALNVVANDWDIVAARLTAHGVLSA